MMPESKNRLPFIGRTVLWACVVHALFILWMYSGTASMLGFIAFYPHLICMYFLPPKVDFYEKGVNLWLVIAKFAIALPASLLYGAAIALFLNRILKRLNPGKGKP
jgi:hypothetical protein